jgi:hypothetical protein
VLLGLAVLVSDAVGVAVAEGGGNVSVGLLLGVAVLVSDAVGVAVAEGGGNVSVGLLLGAAVLVSSTVGVAVGEGVGGGGSVTATVAVEVGGASAQPGTSGSSRSTIGGGTMLDSLNDSLVSLTGQVFHAATFA